MTAYCLSLGSNVGDKRINIVSALSLLKDTASTRVIAQSRLYKTAPQGYTDQDWFLNMAVLIETGLEPQELLKATQRIENHLGRKRSFRNAPRTIDVDIVCGEGIGMHTPDLEIPHPRMAERQFVLIPMLDITDGKRFGMDIAAMSAALPDQGVELYRDFDSEH